MSFEDQVVIVTGAGGGIGSAISCQFAQEGAHLVLADINDNNLKKIGKQVEKHGKKPLLVKGNISNDDDANNLVRQTIKTFGKINVLVNNAGSMKLGTILGGSSVVAFDEMVKNNLRSVVLLTTLAVPYLTKTKGNVVNMSSVAASRTPSAPHLTPYSISKIGVEHFTRGAARELAPSGVRVNAVSPGGVRTNITKLFDAARLLLADSGIGQTPLGKLAKAEEIADVVLFLASDKARSITGSIYTCDNGALLKQ